MTKDERELLLATAEVVGVLMGMPGKHPLLLPEERRIIDRFRVAQSILREDEERRDGSR